MKRINSIIALASIYIGTVIGAGFASGQEIIRFFGRYGYRGIFGVFVAMTLFSFIGTKTLVTIQKHKVKSFDELLSLYFQKKTKHYINLFFIVLLFVNFFVMLAGSGAIFKEHFNISFIYGVIIMGVCSYTVFITGIKGIAKANTILVPFLIGTIFCISFFVLRGNQFTFSHFRSEIFLHISAFKIDITQFGWIGSAIVYVAFNSVGAIVVLSSTLPLISDQKAGFYGGILGGIGLGLMALIILLTLLVLYTSIIGLEVPMIAVAFSLGNFSKNLYSIVLLIAMFTTAITNGYSCVLRIVDVTKTNKNVISTLMCIISIPMATLGFKRLVNVFYPILGYLGVIFLVMLIVKSKMKNKDIHP
ncbi:hypothetical protein RH915_05265 [Serpentinicella sp. ANB-PHB4]|uniref:YkvI family membrane protein n=1 Tax=Serpentinicella sp. ANB-PHB4 TaxID=3074076 RepID=UPI002855D005|nr:hypothetical protein [Serpentinicella sp. ANB-PHB4]MDR5658893.1 hypothetical protein [Serpentinicella sp. ANB-PHB4]